MTSSGIQGLLHSLDSQRVFCPHVNIALICPDGITGNQHTLNYPVGIAFHETAVHKGSGVTFISIADDVFLLAGSLPGKEPLAAGRETSAAAASQARL